MLSFLGSGDQNPLSFASVTVLLRKASGQPFLI